MRYIPYFRGNRFPNGQRQTQHEKTDPVSCKFAPSVFLIYTSRKWAENYGVIVIIDVSVTTP